MPQRLKMPAAFAAMLAVTACATSPYVDDQGRAIKALSSDEALGYREGRGLGLARPAQLNGYPGPKAEVRALGVEYLAQEARLEALFAERRADASGVGEATARAAEIHARIRASHLRTHLEQTALLTPGQVARYAALRGYTPR